MRLDVTLRHKKANCRLLKKLYGTLRYTMSQLEASAQGKAALVTGASRGIGAEVAVRLAHDGFHVIVNYVGDAAAADAVVAQIRSAGGQAAAMQADVSDVDAVASLFDRVSREVGNLQIVVSNAGVQTTGALADVTDEDFDRLIRINLKGSFNVLREAMTRIGPGGRIINLSSGTTTVLQPCYGVYAATKAGVEALTAVAAKEMRGRSITVNAIAPGPVATELFLTGKTSEQLEHAAKQSPLERLGEPHDIASVISFLAGPDGGWVNGQILLVNGAFI